MSMPIESSHLLPQPFVGELGTTGLDAPLSSGGASPTGPTSGAVSHGCRPELDCDSIAFSQFRGTPSQLNALLARCRPRAGDCPPALPSAEQLTEIVRSVFSAFGQQVQQLLQTIQAALSAGAEQPPSGSTEPTSEPTAEPPAVTVPGDGTLMPFAEKARSLLQPSADGLIYEDQLQAAIVAFQLYQKDPAIEQVFQNGLDEALAAGQTLEQAARSALVAVRDQGLITSADADWVNGLSRRAAQLDHGTDELSSERAGGAALEPEAAIYVAERTLAGIATQTIEAKPKALRKS